jgi:hypothetical protein
MSAASTILMVRPCNCGFNDQTAINNYFQVQPGLKKEELIQRVRLEFDRMVSILRENNVEVIVIEDTDIPVKPDAVFPNNWLVTLPDGVIAIFPMFAPNRREERRADIIGALQESFTVSEIQDWAEFENKDKFLEGTGSMVIDHKNKMIYSCISERTDITLLEQFATKNKYQAIVFIATDKDGRPVYHTNVVMTLGKDFCILCEESIEEEWELIAVRELLNATHHSIISISKEQMHCFAGNMLELVNNRNERLLVLSKSAHDCLGKEQKEMLQAFVQLVVVPVPTIEAIGGGSVRCMMTEIFLQKKEVPAMKV